jgi:hypothetical protein
MFEENKYSRLYAAIIHNANTSVRSKGFDIYYEKHHIIPRSLGGTDHGDNLVLLTAKEHYLCHRLLVKMVRGRNRYLMLSALNFLQSKHNNMGLYNSRKFARDREAAWKRSEFHPLKGRPRSDAEAHAKRMVEVGKRKRGHFKHTSEARAKMSTSQKRRDIRGEKNPMFGKPLSDEAKANLSKKNSGEGNPFYRRTHSEEFRARNRGETHAMFGKKHSEEIRAKISAAVAGKQSGARNHRFGKRLNEQEKERLRASFVGRKWVNNGKDQRLLKGEELENALVTGWVPGRLR